VSTEPKDLNPYFNELVKAAQTVVDDATNAARSYADGDAQGACDAVNVMHYKTGQLEDLRIALVSDFEQQGLEPGQR
jgi:hypothetical protein